MVVLQRLNKAQSCLIVIILYTDQIAPVIFGCPPDQTVTMSADSELVPVEWTEPMATDNSGSVTLISDYHPGDSFSFGTTTVTYTATDGAGNIAMCSFNITVSGI